MKTTIRKNLILSGIVSVFICMQVNADAQGYPNVTNNNLKPVNEKSFGVELKMESDSSFRVIVTNPQKKRLVLSISHQDKGSAIDTMIAAEKYNCLYHFDTAEDGHYNITVSNGKEVFRKDFELSTVVTIDRKLNVL